MGAMNRPQRHRTSPLKYWKGERLEYQQSPHTGMATIKKIVKMESPAPVSRSRGKKRVREDVGKEEEETPSPPVKKQQRTGKK